MRVALVTETFTPQINGVVTILKELLRYAERAGHELMLLAPASAPAEQPGAHMVRLSGLPLPLYRELAITPPQPAIKAAIQEFQPAVIHAIGTLLLGPAAVRAGRRLNLPVVASYQSHFALYTRHYGLSFATPLVWRYLRGFHNRATLTLCPSSDTQRRLLGQGFAAPQVWPGGVDTERFHPRYRSLAWRRQHGVDDATPLVLSVGRLAAEKNLGLLAAALEQLPGARAMIVGDGPERAALEQRMGPDAVFTGYLHGDELATAYASADLFVFPSVTETFGQVTLEALASGLPVIATGSGAGADLIQPGLNGLLVPMDDAPALRSAVCSLLRADERRVAMTRAARRTAQEYDWSVVMAQLFEYYHLALAIQRSPGAGLRQGAYEPVAMPFAGK
jgi:phosphatidylinositol alpha 1,6-mannosyltransferase